MVWWKKISLIGRQWRVMARTLLCIIIPCTTETAGDKERPLDDLPQSRVWSPRLRGNRNHPLTHPP